MENELKKEAIRQYLHYFRFWFLAFGILFVIFMGTLIAAGLSEQTPRANLDAPSERVYDYAGVLTEEEENKLRTVIADSEKRALCDIVLITMKQEVETADTTWETGMRNLADDFYDSQNYGYDRVHGDGVLLLDNWYDGQKGSWLSTCGSVYQQFGTTDVNEVLRAVYNKVDDNPYAAYKAYIEMVTRKMSGKSVGSFPVWLVVLLPAVVLISFVAWKLKSPLGKETVTVNAYVAGDGPKMREQYDRFVRKKVTQRMIPKSFGGHGVGGGHGGGGGHISGGGVSHGGGGMRR